MCSVCSSKELRHSLLAGAGIYKVNELIILLCDVHVWISNITFEFLCGESEWGYCVMYSGVIRL